MSAQRCSKDVPQGGSSACLDLFSFARLKVGLDTLYIWYLGKKSGAQTVLPAQSYAEAEMNELVRSLLSTGDMWV